MVFLKHGRFNAHTYLEPPFDEEELLWKIKAVIRRNTEPKAGNQAEIISIGKNHCNSI
jgi:DNA-binding response OmpR family regulator